MWIIDRVRWYGLDWSVRIGNSGGRLWRRKLTFGFAKMLGKSYVAEWLAPSWEEFSCMELVGYRNSQPKCKEFGHAYLTTFLMHIWESPLLKCSKVNELWYLGTKFLKHWALRFTQPLTEMSTKGRKCFRVIKNGRCGGPKTPKVKYRCSLLWRFKGGRCGQLPSISNIAKERRADISDFPQTLLGE
jgi:hypothetical protein